MGPQQANDSLIMSTDYAKPFGMTKGSYVVIMAMDSGYPARVDPSTAVSLGFYTNGPIRNGRGAYFLYVGKNFFPDGAAWSGN